MARKGSAVDDIINLDDAKWLCKKLEINCTASAVETHFKNCLPKNVDRLDYNGYKDLINSFKGRKDIQNLFRNLNMGTDLELELDGFLKFLKDDQHVDVDKERAYWENVFDKFAKPVPNRATLPDSEKDPNRKALTLERFQNFLTSSFNAPLAPSKGDVSLDRPLNEYFISSSHNTYLLGRQVAGASSSDQRMSMHRD
jgi:phosphatidylinositol phospholipase C, delta